VVVVDAIENDVRWLGFEWSNLCHTADYFEQLFDWALHLIRNGDAYVDEQSAEAMRLNRGQFYGQKSRCQRPM